MQSMTRNEFYDGAGVRDLDASTIAFLKITVPGAEILPMLDDEGCTPATLQKHYKFMINASIVPNKDMTYKMAMMYLLFQDGITREMFDGKAEEVKCGMLCFDNEYNTTLRLWSTKKVGKKIVYEITLCGYKGGIKKPHPPSKST